MTGLAVFQVEGVLAAVNDNPRAARPIDMGLPLYEGLRQTYRIAVVSAVFEPEPLRAWLKMHGFTKYDAVECKSSASAMEPAEYVGGHVVDLMRSQLWEVGPIVSANPNVVRIALLRGVPGMLITHPLYLRPEHRPDAERGPRAWSALVEEVELQHELKRNDRRLEAEDVIGGTPNG